MTVLFRADASRAIGSGHIMRCLSLASRLAKMKQASVFVCRDITDALSNRIVDEGHRLISIAKSKSTNDYMSPHTTHASWLSCSWQDDAAETNSIANRENAGWIIVDHYGLDARWEKAVSFEGRKIAVIDDLADRPHSCDLLVDQNLRTDGYARYADLVSQNCQMLLGPRYALLRNEFFSSAGVKPRVFVPEPVRFLVAFGGVDADNFTKLAVECLVRICNPKDSVDVVVSSEYASLDELVNRCNGLNWNIHLNSSELATLMRSADIAIGAGGGMLWERAATGLPAVVMAVADNQKEQVSGAVKRGLILECDREMFFTESLDRMVENLRLDLELRQKISETCYSVVDGRGALRVAQHLEKPGICLRPALVSDGGDIYAWRNDPHVRRFSRSSAEISLADHSRWLSGVLNDHSKRLLIAEDGEGSLGVVRFDISGQTAEISIYLVPERIGFGLGASLLIAAGAWLQSHVPEVKKIIAEILPSNKASIELFGSCGYRFDDGRYVNRIKS
jgi:UDP-2,4-diacetamido-2,4,6-trideoxy-beta-L-altropyranose hydrolase